MLLYSKNKIFGIKESMDFLLYSSKKSSSFLKTSLPKNESVSNHNNLTFTEMCVSRSGNDCEFSLFKYLCHE